MNQPGKWIGAAIIAIAMIAALVLLKSPRVSGVSVTSGTSVKATRLPIGISVPGARVMLREIERSKPWHSGGAGRQVRRPELFISLYAVPDQAIPGDPVELGATRVEWRGFATEGNDQFSYGQPDQKHVALDPSPPSGALVTVRQQTLPLTKDRQARFTFSKVSNADLPLTRSVGKVVVTLRGIHHGQATAAAASNPFHLLRGSQEMIAEVDVTAPVGFRWDDRKQATLTAEDGKEMAMSGWSQAMSSDEERATPGPNGQAAQPDPNKIVKTQDRFTFYAGDDLPDDARLTLKLSGTLPPKPGDGAWITFEQVRVP